MASLVSFLLLECKLQCSFLFNSILYMARSCQVRTTAQYYCNATRNVLTRVVKMHSWNCASCTFTFFGSALQDASSPRSYFVTSFIFWQEKGLEFLRENAFLLIRNFLTEKNLLVKTLQLPFLCKLNSRKNLIRLKNCNKVGFISSTKEETNER